MLLSRGEPQENTISASEHGPTNILLQEDWGVSDAYGVDGTPSAVLMQTHGTMASPVVEGTNEVSEFLRVRLRNPEEGLEGALSPLYL